MNDRIELLENQLREQLDEVKRVKLVLASVSEERDQLAAQAILLAGEVGSPELAFAIGHEPTSDASHAMHQVRHGIGQLKKAARLPDLEEAYPLVFHGVSWMAINFQDPKHRDVLQVLLEQHRMPVLSWYVGQGRRIMVTMASDGEVDVGSIAKKFGGNGRESYGYFDFDWRNNLLTSTVTITDLMPQAAR